MYRIRGNKATKRIYGWREGKVSPKDLLHPGMMIPEGIERTSQEIFSHYKAVPLKTLEPLSEGNKEISTNKTEKFNLRSEQPQPDQ